MPAGGWAYAPSQLFVAPPAMAPSADCSQLMNWICRVRLVAQSALAVGESGCSAAGPADMAQAASGFWYPPWS